MRSAYLATSVTEATVRALNYTPEVGRFRKIIPGAKVSLLEELATIRTPGNAMFRARDCSPQYGKEFLTQADIFAAETNGRIIQADLVSDVESRQAKSGQILIAGVGTLGETELYGRAIIADKRLEGKLLSSDVLILEPNLDEDTHAYLYAFLCSRVGVRMVRSTSAGTKLLRPRRDLLRKLPIPVPDDKTLKQVADLIRSTITNREQYLSEVQAARACLEALPEMQEAIQMCQERKARCTVWDGNLPTITAWTYASAGQALKMLLEKWKLRVGDFVSPSKIFNGPRFARTACVPPHGIDFMSQRDVFMIRPAPRRIALPNLPRNELFVPEGTLLVGSNGQLSEGSLFGQVAWCDSEMANAAFTQHILRVGIDPEYAPIAFAFLSSIVGKRLMNSTAVGTSIPMMRADLVRALPFPEIDTSLHSLVAKHVKTGVAARVTATNAEKEAICIIEDEVLPQWLA